MSINLNISEDLWAAAQQVFSCIKKAGARAYVVGGAVRDALLSKESSELDIEVFGLETDALAHALSQVFTINIVGKAFGVIKLKGIPIDISIARTESKIAQGHQGFSIKSNLDLSLEQGSLRRDFTMNAIFWDPINRKIIDLHGGQKDLLNKTLRPTSLAFKEDPLRVFRAMQMLARFELSASDELISTCKSMQIEGIAKERIWPEWQKLFVLAKKPSLGLIFLKKTSWIRYYPQLEQLGEGAWARLLCAMDFWAIGQAVLTNNRELMGLSILGSSLILEGRDSSEISALLDLITMHEGLKMKALSIIQGQNELENAFFEGLNNSLVRKLSVGLGCMDRVAEVYVWYHPEKGPMLEDLKARATELGVWDRPLFPILQGRHLAGLGVPPGPEYQQILDACFEAQIAGDFDSEDAAIEYLKLYLAS